MSTEQASEVKDPGADPTFDDALSSTDAALAALPDSVAWALTWPWSAAVCWALVVVAAILGPGSGSTTVALLCWLLAGPVVLGYLALAWSRPTAHTVAGWLPRPKSPGDWLLAGAALLAMLLDAWAVTHGGGS